MNNTMTTEKVRAGQPYLYRKNGLPSEVYEIRMTNFVEHSALNTALDMTMQRYPYFTVGGYTAIENAFVKAFLLDDGETVSDAKLRLAEEQLQRCIAKRDAILKHRHIA